MGVNNIFAHFKFLIILPFHLEISTGVSFKTLMKEGSVKVHHPPVRLCPSIFYDDDDTLDSA